MSGIRHVIWDWNGTLLDDVECCVDTLNTLLSDRQMRPISRDRYLELFDFPVRDFYVALGFDFERERFEDVSSVYMRRYEARQDRMALREDAHAALGAVRALGLGQTVLSAMERQLLGGMLRRFGVDGFMQGVHGLDHIHATSKVGLGIELMAALDAAPSEVLFVGDTLHDLEVARAMGCRCVLHEAGHQHADRLRQAGARTVASLAEAVDALGDP